MSLVAAYLKGLEDALSPPLRAILWRVLGLGLALSVLVLAAALPTGSNAMLFAQRYQVREAEASTVIVLSTAGFMLSAPLWLTLLDLWRRSGLSAAAAG